jgi:hypothetical protein
VQQLSRAAPQSLNPGPPGAQFARTAVDERPPELLLALALEDPLDPPDALDPLDPLDPLNPLDDPPELLLVPLLEVSPPEPEPASLPAHVGVTPVPADPPLAPEQPAANVTNAARLKTGERSLLIARFSALIVSLDTPEFARVVAAV